MGNKHCTYLRIVATTRCNLACGYCHMEGDAHRDGTPFELTGPDLALCLEVAAAAGIQKFKFLGGEPLLRGDLCDQVRGLRAVAPRADLSVITAGVVPPSRVRDLYGAGLSRINVTLHGFSPSALASRIPSARAHEQRSRFIDAVLAEGRPVKLNYVYGSLADRDDLAGLLAWAAPRRVVVGLLDDLGQDHSWQTLARVLKALVGAPEVEERVDDPHSLPTLQWWWPSGLRVELKDQQLGQVAPWSTCTGCPVRARCKEGIFALRLTHTGRLQPCMDRPDLGLPLLEIAKRAGVRVAVEAWNDYVRAS